MKDFEIAVFAIRGEDNETYYSHLHSALENGPQITMDDGADLVTAVLTDKKEFIPGIIGSTEETTTGIIRLRSMAEENILRFPVIAVNDANTKHLFDNRYGTGQSTIESPCGLTGRKIIVDTYGGVGSHGGGAFSGKDPSKVDRSASYMARHIAKNCVAAGLAERMEIQLAYAIGIPEPVSLMVDTFGTAQVSEETIRGLIKSHFQLTPQGIIDSLDLRKPIFRKTAAYGHFGREEEGFTWELTDKADLLRRKAELPEMAAKPVIV